jgi:circadian clock protein KaiB
MLKRRSSPKPTAAQKAFEKAASKRKPEAHLFRLYIAGSSERSLRAVKKIKEICEKELQGLYTLEIIDLYQQPARAIADQIVAAPTLVRRLPEPVRLVGDLSDESKVMALFNTRSGKNLK